jgi:AAA family ATP:ADP antiporter
MSAAQPADPADATVLATAVAAAGGLAAFEIAGLAARDGLFLSQLPASQLPAVMLTAAGVSLCATLALSQWLRRARPERVAPLALLFSAGAFTGIGVLAQAAPAAAAVLLYVQVAGIGPVVASSFWSVVNERFDPYQAKRVVARMAAAGALGGVLGGVLAERLATWTGIPVLLFVLAGLCCACALGVRAVGARPGAANEHASGGTGADSGLALLRRIPLLRQMALLMLLAAVIETLVEYALKAEAARSFQTDESLVRFFAVFYTSCGLLSFGIQSFTGDRFLRRFGLAGAVAALPASVALLGSPGTLIAKLWTVTLARGAENVASTAFFRAGFQLLYTPMATTVKRPAKVWVDVASGSTGEMLGAGLILGLLFALPQLPTQAIMVLAVVGSLGALAIARRVHQSYVTELTDSLRRGRVEIRAEDALDKTTFQTIVQSQMGLSRTSLLEQVRAFDADGGTGTRPVSAEPRPAAPSALQTGGDPTLGWIQTLSSKDEAAILSALAGGIETTAGATPERRRRLVPWVVSLLAEEPLARAARNFLRPIAPRAVGQLVDLLLDSDQPLRVRTRVAWILGGVDSSRAVDGLWRACADDEFEVRAAGARALCRLTSRAPELGPGRDDVYAAVLRELDEDEPAGFRRPSQGDPTIGEGSVLLGRKALEAVPAGLEHVFTLLALAHERQLVASALAGLAGRDESLRGTALELLESVLPARLRRRLWPRLHAPARSGESSRSSEQIADELLKNTASQVIDRDALRKSS